MMESIHCRVPVIMRVVFVCCHVSWLHCLLDWRIPAWYRCICALHWFHRAVLSSPAI